MSLPIAVIVDPFSSGNLLAPEFHSRGYECISVLSGPVPEVFQSSYRRDDFVSELTLEHCQSTLLAELSQRKVTCVIPGCESGVLLANQLAFDLGLPCNDLDYSEARRDKYLMQNRLHQAGLKSIKQKRTSSITEALAWASHVGYPIVVKPLDSAGSDNVSLCYSKKEVQFACKKILGKTNLFGRVNNAMLLQELIEGTEYVVDTVSCEATHFVSNVCVYRKENINGAAFVYKDMRFLTDPNDYPKALIPYCRQVLDALGVRFGAAHCEVIVDEQGVPTLIEAGARMQGSGSPNIVREIARHSQVNLTVDSVIDPKYFFENTITGNLFHQHARCFVMASNIEGNVSHVDVDFIKALPSYYSSTLHAKPGKKLLKTTDLINCPGWVFLIHPSKEQVDRDFEKLVEMEQTHLLYIFEQEAHEL